MYLLLNGFSWLLLLFATGPVLYLLLTTLKGWRPGQGHALRAEPARIAIIIPAHDEATLIANTVQQARALDYPVERFTVLVVADNCSDDTAALARAAGARVLERDANPGKGQGLNDALGMLMAEPWDAFVVLDADSVLHPRTLVELDAALADGARAIQIRYGVSNPDDTVRTRAMELATASFNALRPLGRMRLGLSAGINGNGFCLTRATVEQVPYLAHSIVEDIEYHMLLLRNDIRVRFIDTVWVKAQMPLDAATARSQRVRWERGRIATIRTYAPDLFRRWRGGQSTAFDGLIDVLMPPMSLIVLAMVPALAIGPPAARLLALAGMFIILLHYVVAAHRFGKLSALPRLMLFVPQYVLWKTFVVIRSLFTEKHLPWVRTERH